MGRFAADHEASLERPSIFDCWIPKPPRFNFVLPCYYLRCCSRIESASIGRGGMASPYPDKPIISVAAHASKAPALSAVARSPHTPTRLLSPLLLTHRKRQHWVRWQGLPIPRQEHNHRGCTRAEDTRFANNGVLGIPLDH